MKKIDEAKQAYQSYVNRISRERIPQYESSFSGKEKEYLTEVIDGNWVSEGKYVREFESQLARIAGKDYAVAFCNATAALITGMKGLGIGQGDDVIVPSLSHSADPNSIVQVGANPIFADINRRTLCLSVDNISSALTDKTKAVLYVNAYGNTDEIDKVEEFLNLRNIYLINDSAPALNCQFEGRPISSFGAFSILSFYADKTISTGEGGALLTDDQVLVKESNMYKHDGRKERGYDIIDRIGFNFRMTEMQAAVGVAQIERLQEICQQKLAVYHQYQKGFNEFRHADLLEYHKQCQIVPHRVVIFVENGERLVEYLVSKGIGARRLFMPMHSQSVYGLSDEKFPNTILAYKEGVCLPSAPTLTTKQISHVISTVRSYYG